MIYGMDARWPTLVAPAQDRALSGDGSFRLMPTDDLATAPATRRVETGAGGHALLLRYTWTHPTDGEQDGILLCAAAGEDGDALTATWLDSWHQKPFPLTLSGTLAGSGVQLLGVYAETWGWEINLTLGEARVGIEMRNVIPQEAVDQAPPEMAGIEAGPYTVMELDLRAGATA